MINLPASLKEGTAKDGSKYLYVSIMLTPTYEKRVFLDTAEKEILRLSADNKKEDK